MPASEALKNAKKKYALKNKDKIAEYKSEYYKANKSSILKKKKELYKKVEEDTSRNYRTLKKKIGDFADWKLFTGDYSGHSPAVNGVKLNLLNKITNDVCLHCLCGHRIGKLERKVITLPETPISESNPILDDVDNEHKKTIVKNSKTFSYKEASLLPFVNGSDNYILVAKTCAKYFCLSEEQVKAAFKKNKAYFYEKSNPIIKKKMSLDPKILLSKFEKFHFGKHKGLSIYTVNKLRGGSAYLEFATRWDICQESIDAIEDLLYQNTF